MTYVTGQQSLPPNTIVPEEEHLFVPYLNRMYEDIAYAVNAKNESPFTIAITNVPTDIASIPTFGTFFVCIAGLASGQPVLGALLCKSDAGIAGVVVPLGNQAGTGAVWAASFLTITSTVTRFQIQHSVAGLTANFSIKIIGTNEF